MIAAATNRARRRAAARASRRRRVIGGLTAAGVGAAAVAGGVLGAGPASAAAFEVTTLSGTGPGSLSAAVELANAAPGADLITFVPGLTGTIVMPFGVLIRDSLTITGPGADLLSLSGDGDHSVLSIAGDSLIDVALSGLTVTAGATYDSDGHGDGDGGGIFASSANLTLVDDAFTGNHGGNGGALVVFRGSLNVTGTTFADNLSEQNGGAIFIADSTSSRIASSTFTGNTAVYRGGAINSYSTDLEIADSTFAGNSTFSSSGGAVAASGGAFSLSTSEFDGNGAAAREGSGHGGALFLDGTGVAVIVKSTFTGNTATSGGGAIAGAGPYNSSGTLAIADSTITGNIADATAITGWGGGAITLIDRLTLSLDHVTMVGNENVTAAPTINSADSVTIANSAIHNPGSTSEVAAASQSVAFSTVGTDPQLGPLQDNGGPTRTMLPLPGSPLIDSGDPSLAGGADQRGLDRVVRTTDRGAAELQAVSITDPVDATLEAGSPASFAVSCASTAPAAVQWFRSNDGGATWSPIPGATRAKYTIESLVPDDDGSQFRATCATPEGAATSAPATLAVIGAAAPDAAGPPAIAAAGSEKGADLPATGAEPAAYVPVGIGLLGLGAAMVASVWRRGPDRG